MEDANAEQIIQHIDDGMHLRPCQRIGTSLPTVEGKLDNVDQGL